MAFCGLVAHCAFKTIGKTALFIAQWCTIQAFVHATMWHNTEPRTLGISYWAAGIFIGAICFPGLLYIIIGAVLPASRPLMGVWNLIISFFAKTVPALALWISSLPLLDNEPQVRTAVLGCAVVFISLYIIAIAWACSDSCKSFAKRTTKSSEKSRTEICALSHKSTRKSFLRSLMGSSVGNDVIIAICATMGLRWNYESVNVFYEDWKASMILMIVVLAYAIASLFLEHFSGKYCPSSAACMERKSSACNKRHKPKYKCKKLPDTSEIHGGNHATHGSGDRFLHGESPSEESDGKDPSFSHVDEASDERNGIDQLSTSRENNTTVSSTVADTVTRRYTNGNVCFAFIYALVLALSIGSLGYMFIWIYTSPAVLYLWGELSDGPAGYVIFSCFSFGCFLAALISTESVCSTTSDELCTNNNEKSEAKQMRCLRWTMNSLILVMTAGGCGIVLYTVGALFLFGAAILCIASPILLKIIMTMSFNLIKMSKSLRVSGIRCAVNILPGTMMFVSGLTFLIFHFLGIMFISPQMTALVHGKMGAILWPQVILAVLPLVCGTAFRNKITLREQLRSPSTGPLLAPDSPHLRNGVDDHKVTENSLPNINGQRAEKYRKISQYVFLLSLFVLLLLGKGVSSIQKNHCNISDGDTGNCDPSRNSEKYNLRVMSWNILLGHTMTGRNNLGKIASLADEYNPHVLALQEATGHPPYWGGKDVFGYIRANSNYCRRGGSVVNPRKGSFEVGMLSRFKITSQSSKILPNGGAKKIPSYTMAKISCQIFPECNISEELGSGFHEYSRPQSGVTLHVYTLHTVYKNWTCERESQLSCRQMQLIHDDIAKLPENDPVIVMGDFNINPSEPELDIWFQSYLGFKSALWPSRNYPLRKNFNYTCGTKPQWNDEECDCECRGRSSDPPKTTLLNRKAAVDHIFYRGLKLVGKGKILDNIGNISDHYPVLADFVV